jgi:hypothetical protein
MTLFWWILLQRKVNILKSTLNEIPFFYNLIFFTPPIIYAVPTKIMYMRLIIINIP